MKCECPYDEVISEAREWQYSDEELEDKNHKAFDCRCTNNLKYYLRDGKEICLCSKCCMPGDKEVN